MSAASSYTRKPLRLIVGAFLVAYYCLALLPGSASAAGARDSDHDGMPNAWENHHGLNPFRANARFDPDHDGLRNVGEFHAGTQPHDADTDEDGLEDGDEVQEFDTDPTDEDSDDDGVVDGNDDSDDDGVEDGDEDGEDQGEDEDGDGQDDLAGTIVSFDAETGLLTFTSSLEATVQGVVNGDTELQWDGDCEGDSAATTADLVPGTGITEIEWAGEGVFASVDLACASGGGEG